MPCTNGRIVPTQQTKLRLFSDAAGHCCRPTCRRRLFSDDGEEDYNIAEMAHIIAAMDGGPRADTEVTSQQRAEYDNLILLCPNCHTEIDRAPQTFTVDVLREWKMSHRAMIAQAIGVARMDNRREAREFVERILRINQNIFDELNPNLAYSENPEAEEAAVWKRKMRSQIIPNNQAILLFLDTNTHLLNEAEQIILEQFRQHVDDLIQRHLGDNTNTARRFPAAILTILEG